jgi:hypothetical protein
MTTIGSSTSYSLTVPALSDSADIQVALRLLSYGSSGDPANDAAVSANSLAGYLLTKSPIASPTFTGTVTLPTGTSSIAPLKFISGTNLTTPVAGTIEYDGKLFYGTPKVNNTTAGRGLLPSQYLIANSSSVTNAFSVTGATTSSQSYTAFGKSLYAATNTSYLVNAHLKLRITTSPRPTGSTSASISFAGPSGISVSLEQMSRSSLDSSFKPVSTSVSHTYVSDTSSATIIASSSSSTTYYTYNWSGIVSTSSTAGNIYPRFTLTARGDASGGPDGEPGTSTITCELVSGSYCKITPIGTAGAEINIGGWD